MPRITAHTIVRNDESFVAFAIRSVIDHVDHLLVFDTGSTDGTSAILRNLAGQYPGKIEFDEKGPCDQSRHTELRQEMVDRTTTDWFLILDGDEVWTKRGIVEAVEATAGNQSVRFIVAPYYNCVGDIFHDYRRRGSFQILGRTERLTPRLVRLVDGLRWNGEYGHDLLVDADGTTAFNVDNSVVLRNPFWHLTHLSRSSGDGSVYSSGGTRADKRRPTYLGIGRRIKEAVPEVFDETFRQSNRMGLWRAAVNALRFGANRVWWQFRHGRQPG